MHTLNNINGGIRYSENLCQKKGDPKRDSVPVNAGEAQFLSIVTLLDSVSVTGNISDSSGQEGVKNLPDTDSKIQEGAATLLPLPLLCGNLLEEVASGETLQFAWEKCFRKKDTAAGIDHVSMPAAYETYKQNQGKKLQNMLLGCRYRPKPVKRVYIPKRNGERRPLGIPTVEERVVQNAILQVLQTKLEPYFHEYSFGFRPRRSVYDASQVIKQFINEGYTWCADFDIRKFFDNVDHSILGQELKRIIQDSKLLELINSFMKAGTWENGKTCPTDIGIPQGGPLSPLLANVILHRLDMEASRRKLKLIRYADDFIILTRSRRSATRAMHNMSKFLETINLKVNERKTRVILTESLEFLGFAFTGKQTHICRNNIHAFKRTIRFHLKELGQGNMDQQPLLTSYLHGWFAHYARIDDQTQLYDLKNWFCRMMMKYHIPSKLRRELIKTWKRKEASAQSMPQSNG